MDYIFFAFSALCLGFAVLLLFLIRTGQDTPPLLRQLLMAAAAAVLYYYLDLLLFKDNLVLYYIANLLPQGLLFMMLTLFLWRRSPKS